MTEMAPTLIKWVLPAAALLVILVIMVRGGQRAWTAAGEATAADGGPRAFWLAMRPFAGAAACVLLVSTALYLALTR